MIITSKSDLDLSNDGFMATANTLDSIATPLLNLMEMIAVEGFTDDEKVAIAPNHHLAQQG